MESSLQAEVPLEGAEEAVEVEELAAGLEVGETLLDVELMTTDFELDEERLEVQVGILAMRGDVDKLVIDFKLELLPATDLDGA